VFAPGAGAPTVRGGLRFWCRSTALGANGGGHISASGRAFSHPGRVLLRFGESCGSGVGAPPRCERGGHISAAGRAFSHPGRVLLRFGEGPGFGVGAPPSVRTGRVFLQWGDARPALKLTPPDRGFPAWVCFLLRRRG